MPGPASSAAPAKQAQVQNALVNTGLASPAEAAATAAASMPQQAQHGNHVQQANHMQPQQAGYPQQQQHAGYAQQPQHTGHHQVRSVSRSAE